jgi:hypothetical protein
MLPCRGVVVEPGMEAASADRVQFRRFRQDLYGCFRRRGDALFELVDAVLTMDGPVSSLVELSLESTFRRGHGALYDALACGDVDVARLSHLVAGAWEPPDCGPLKFAVDVSPWDRPYAETSPQRHFCHTSCVCGNRSGTVPGWPYSLVAGLEWGATSWSAPLDMRRIAVGEDVTAVSAGQVAAVVARCAQLGQLVGRSAPVFVFDAGYDLTRIAVLTRADGVDVQVLGRVRCNRVFYGDAAHEPGKLGRPSKHGDRFDIQVPETWHEPDQCTETDSPRYGKVQVSAWHRLHQKLARQAAWLDWPGELPNVPGTVIRIQVERLPGNRNPEDLWLWHTAPEGAAFDLDLLWMAYLRRFDIEHTFRLFKQLLGWTAPQFRTPEQGDTWTWLVVAAYTQLRLARTLVGDMVRPWQKRTAAGRMPTPGRIRRGFRILARKIGTPARKPKRSTAGPGRPKGTTRPPRPVQPIGENSDKPDKKPTRGSRR